MKVNGTSYNIVNVLTAKQLRFIDSYLAQGNKVDAVIFAGYPPKSANVLACQLLKNPRVMAKITEIRKKIALNEDLKPAKEFSRDDFVNYALRDYESLESIEPNKPRFLQLAGQAKGYIGANPDARPSQTLNLTQINITGNENAPELWELTRKLIGNS